MEVLSVNTPRGERWILVDDNYNDIEEVHLFLKHLSNIERSPNTLKNYCYHLKLFYEYMEYIEINVLEIRSASIGALNVLSNFMFYLRYPRAAQNIYEINKESPVRSERTTNIIISVILEFYEFLAVSYQIESLDLYGISSKSHYKHFMYEMNLGKKSKNKKFLKLKEAKKRIQYITRKQFDEIFSSCNNLRDKLLVSLLFECGLRIGEALGIQYADLDEYEKGILKVVFRDSNPNNARVKNRAEGIVIMPNSVLYLLEKYINNETLDYESDFLFINLYGANQGLPMTKSNVNRIFENLSQKIGYHVHPHMLRHGFATEKLSNGWQMIDIAEHLRHRSISSTTIYAEYTLDIRKRKMRNVITKHKEGVIDAYEKISGDTANR